MCHMTQRDATLRHVLTRPLARTSCTAVDLYSESAGRSTGYPVGFYSLSQFRRWNSDILPRLDQDGFIGNSFQFLIFSQPSIQRCIA